MDVQLLHYIYHFTGVDIRDTQDAEVCVKLISLFGDFSKYMSEKSRYEQQPNVGCNKEHYDYIYDIVHKLESANTDLSIKWFPKYACAVLFHRAKDQWSGKLSIDVIGLDKHEVEVHTGQSNYQFTSSAQSFATLHVGEISLHEKAELIKKFEVLFEKKSSKKGNDRSAAGNEQGHQKTPSFIYAVLLQAKMCSCERDCECIDVLPKGGFTDVGLHTGGQKRDTYFALARSVFQWLFDQAHLLVNQFGLFTDVIRFDPVMVHFHMYVLEKAIVVVNDIDTSVNAGNVEFQVDQRIRFLFEMLRHVSILAARLVDDGYNFSMFCVKLKEFRDRINHSKEIWDNQMKHKFTLRESLNKFHCPTLQIPGFTPPQVAEELSVEKFQLLIKDNIGELSLSNRNLEDTKNWVKQVKGDCKKSATKIFVFLREIEQVFWKLSEDNLGNEPLTADALDSLMYLIDHYREVVEYYSKSGCISRSTLLNRIRCVELLLIWVGYCAVFNTLKRMHPDMEHFGTALHYQDLKYLLLHDKTHIAVMERVAYFLHTHTVSCKDLFSTRMEQNWRSPTFMFGEMFSKRHLSLIWREEEHNAQTRVREHWKEVQRKQNLAKQLRSELISLEIQLDDEKRKAEDFDYDGDRTYVGRQALEQTRRFQGQIDRKKNEITIAEKAPPPVIQPLPNNMDNAMKVLFFMHMPSEFLHLSRLTFTAQQALVPKPWGIPCGGVDGVDKVDFYATISVDKKVYDWTNHYNYYQRSSYYTPSVVRKGVSLSVGLSMHNSIPDNRDIGPNHVDSFTDCSQGIWYPDTSDVRMVWSGGNHVWDRNYTRTLKEFNPFKIATNFTASYFTEKLNKEHSNLQWSLYMQELKTFPPNHGNRPYASQNLKPQLFTKEGYLDYTSIRRFPSLALRRLCSAMKRGSLPIQHDLVQKLIRQTLYQIGELSMLLEGNQSTLRMTWRNDIEEICKALTSILSSMTSIQKERTFLYKASAMIGELSSYLLSLQALRSNDDDILKKCSHSLAEAAIDWAKEYDDQVEKASPEQRPFHRSKQVIFYRTALLCVIHGEMDSKTARIVLTCTVQARNMFVQEDEDSDERDLLRDLSEYCLANRLGEYLNIITKNDGIILSEALRTVITSAQYVTKWKREKVSHASFSASDSSGQCYSINTLTGVILVNGLPPNQLPSSITEDDLYRKVFERNNFEVITKLGYFETTCAIFGCYYRFHKAANGNVVIQESSHRKFDDADTWNNPFELVSSSSLQPKSNFPKKLQTLFTHWVSRKQNIIAFRQFDFRERDIYYIHHMNQFKIIPKHIQTRDDWRSIVERIDQMDSVVVHQSQLLDILERFDSRCMMITEISNETYMTRLHRFSLTFKFNSAVIFHCSEITGYHLRASQHLPGQLRGLHQYLILDSEDGTKTKVIIPFGKIVVNTRKEVQILLLNTAENKLNPSINGAEEEMKFFIYDMHPTFDTLVANGIAERLYLAALYTATNSSVPDNMIGMTGEEKAIELTRQCTKNWPMSPIERCCLDNLKVLSKNCSSTLYILCHYIDQSCLKYSFLFRDELSDGKETGNQSEILSDAATMYLNRLQKPQSSRLRLTEGECQRSLGKHNPIGWKRCHRVIQSFINIESCPVNRKDIDNIYDSINDMLTVKEKEVSKPFPLKSMPSTKLEENVYGELKESWKLHCKVNGMDEIPNRMNVLSLKKVDVLTRKIESYLLRNLNDEPCKHKSHWHAQAVQFYRLANIIPIANKQDLVSIACKRTRIKDFNPLLSSRAQDRVHNSVLLWLELCVLATKIKHLLSFPSDNLEKNKAYIQELLAVRKWDIHKHPYWLVFEAEQGIRIRPEQYEVASHLIQNKGDIVQLNMGLGKTRVIIPMLVLYWTFSDEVEYIARLCVLSTLLMEGCDYFHRVLCASTLGRKLFVLPFQRDVDINMDEIKLLHDMTHCCRQEGGFVAVAPEHRLSLELKVKELHLNGEINLSKELEKVVLDTWCDILDEVDEILHHRFQLVYSIGNVQPLPQGKHRWRPIQALLKTIKSAQVDGVDVKPNKDTPEAFPWVSIDDNVDIHNFRLHIGNLLLEDPPREVDWLREHNLKDSIYRIITEPNANPNSISLSEEHYFDVLTLRGLLAYDILLHCLRKRHRVDYGVNKDGKKHLSVPFRGADTPSQRAEFSHPDCAITLTNLAYYDQGISKDEICRVFELLLCLGKNCRTGIYDEWLDLSKMRMQPSIYDTVSNINKIDLTNCAKVDILFEYFHKNPATINFWLNSYIFPREVDQYPQRLVANSWHLAHHNNNNCVGFSGTNDNHKILPLQVKQYLPWKTDNSIWRNLLSTNGRMLDIILNKTVSCKELEKGVTHETLLSFMKTVLDEGRSIDALIDCGALLAGRSNFDVARFIINECLSQVNDRLRGVTFFDESTNTWMILEASGRCDSKDHSPLMEKETFALFDEPRCRGVDLKLRSDAVALLTLGQNICKDKIMQAAGRMRQLSRGQKLMITGEPKIFNEIRRVNNISGIMQGMIENETIYVKHVLSWIMHNTIKSIKVGIGMWSEQGVFYAAGTKPEHSVLNETMELSDFYGKPIQETPISDLAVNAKKFHCNRTKGGNQLLINKIIDQSQYLGDSYIVMRTGVDEECERELELEVEEEEEEEVEYTKMSAFNEVDWDFSSILKSTLTEQLPVYVHEISHIMCKYFSCKSLAHIGWSKKVLCTDNFIRTIQFEDNLDDFLRIPDCFVLFPNGELLLLSEREANKVLQLFQSRKSKTFKHNHYFGHYAFENDSSQVKFLGYGEICAIPDDIACSLKLLNGETMYPGTQRSTMKSMLSNAKSCNSFEKSTVTNASGEPETLVQSRGKNADYDRSDLERVCIELACEAVTTGSNTIKRAINKRDNSDILAGNDITSTLIGRPMKKKVSIGGRIVTCMK